MTEPDSASGSIPTALITGAGSGIGRATAVELARRGHLRLTLVDLRADGFGETAMQVAAVAPDADCLQLTADVGDADQLTEVFATTIERFGRLDVVINNAGMKTAAPGFPEGSVAMIDQVLNTNLRGVIIGTQLAHRHMAANGGGSIVSTASGAGKMPLPTDPLYATTKAGVINFTQSCAPLFAADGVRINAVCPDIVDTPMFTGKGHSPELTAIIEAMTMLRPDEVATAIVDLALDLDTTGATPSVIGHPDGFRLV